MNIITKIRMVVGSKFQYSILLIFYCRAGTWLIGNPKTPDKMPHFHCLRRIWMNEKNFLISKLDF